MEKKEPSYVLLVVKVNWHSLCGEQCWGPLTFPFCNLATQFPFAKTSFLQLSNPNLLGSFNGPVPGGMESTIRK